MDYIDIVKCLAIYFAIGIGFMVFAIPFTIVLLKFADWLIDKFD